MPSAPSLTSSSLPTCAGAFIALVCPHHLSRSSALSIIPYIVFLQLGLPLSVFGLCPIYHQNVLHALQQKGHFGRFDLNSRSPDPHALYVLGGKEKCEFCFLELFLSAHRGTDDLCLQRICFLAFVIYKVGDDY